MRPLELSVEGFRSYRDRETLTFDGRGLFGIVGPTGAGKSSILDALIYALYGKTPRVERDTKKLIASGGDDARVRLVFEVDESVWEVTRVLRTRGASQVVLVRRGEDGAEASGERKVNDRIAELIGLDYDAFCSSVTLPQGEFDRFLRATRAERTQILKRVFRLERVDLMREAAKRRRTDLEGVLRSYEGQIAALRADPQLLQELRAESEDAKARAGALRDALAEVAGAERMVESAEARMSEIRRRAAEVERAVEETPGAASLEDLAGEEDEARRLMARSEEALAEAAGRLEEARSGAAGAEERLGGGELARAKELARDRARLASGLDSLRASGELFAEAVEEARAAHEAQRTAAEAAERELASGDEALSAARQHHAAHLLRTSLRPGERCPVCEQEVSRPPAAGRAPALERAQRAKDRAEKAARSAAERMAELGGALSSATARREGVLDEVSRAEQEAGRVDRELAALLGGEVDAHSEIERREEVLREALAAVEGARSQVESRSAAAAAARKAVEEVASRRRLVAGALIRTCTQLGIDAPGVDDDAASLAGAAKRAADAGTLRIRAEEERAAAVAREASAARGIVEGFRVRFRLRPGESGAEALEEATKRVGAVDRQIADVEQAIAKRAELEGEIEKVAARTALYERLAADLTDAKFTAYLLDEQRRLLARLGGDKLMQLTGRYRFDEEGEFHIVDVLMGESVRSPDTLSGGETFLASLALALALAEAVAEGGSRLGCFFLDEGFGSLDAASLDLALEGIETLAVPGRLIGLITHVAGVQARLDDLIVLDRSDDGTTIVVQTEGPISYAAATI